MSPAAATGTRGAWASVLRSAGVRVLVLPVSAIIGIVNTRLIVENFGQASYAQYGLLVGIGSLLPFADLGVSAALMNAVGGSTDPRSDPRVRAVLTTAVRVLIGSATVIVALAVALTVAGVWPQLLGDGLMTGSGPLAAALCLGLIGLAMPVGFGQRILAGLGQNHVSVALLGLQSPVVLVVLLLMVRAGHGGGSFVAVVPFVVTLVISIGATYLASRRIAPAVGHALRDLPRLRAVRSGEVFGVAWPMLLQMIALPIAMQTDRLILSHVSDLRNLAQYNLASQMYSPVWQVVSAAGVALWPIFAKARGTGQRNGASPLSMAVGFGAAAVPVCLLISAVSGWLAGKASGGTIHLGVGLLISFSIFMVLQAVKYPLGMYMTDARGLRYQAFMIILLLPVNLGLSLVLAMRYGAVGPVIGSAVGVFLCQVLANWVYVRRELAARERQQPLESAGVSDG